MCRRLSNTFHTRVNSSTASMHALRHLPQLTIPPNSNYWYAKSVFVGCRMKALGSACISLAATAMHPLHLGHRQGSNASSKAKIVQREQWVFMLMSPPLEPWQLFVGWQNLVVFDRCSGSNIQYPEFRNQPADRVSVYLPGHSKVLQIVKFKSWACDIVPALLEPKRAAQYTVIVHNGDMPGSGPL